MSYRKHHGLGWVPDVPSVKDFVETTPAVAELLKKTKLKGRVAARARAPQASKSVDLRQWFSPVEDQGDLGSCTANAAIALIEYFEKRASGRHIDASRLFLYKVTRKMMGWTGDTGAYIRSAMGALAVFGAPPEHHWPYDGRPEGENDRFELEPDAFCYAFAANYKALKYLRLDSPGVSSKDLLKAIKQYLSNKLPAMFGFPVYDEFMYPESGGKVPFPSAASNHYGGHAVVAAGYDDDMVVGGEKGALLVRNSWGPNWGDNGYCWMSYRYVLDELALDWWTVLKQDWVDTGKF